MPIVKKTGWVVSTARNISARPEFEPWTVKPVASFYTDDDIPTVDCSRKPQELRRQHYSWLGLPERL